MSQVKLSDEQWTIILAFLRNEAHVDVGQEANYRRFVEAVLWMTRSGTAWRLLPAEYGDWIAGYMRFAR